MRSCYALVSSCSIPCLLSIHTPFHLPLKQRDHLLYLTWSHLCSPAGLAAPPRTQYLGGQESLLCFHFTWDLSHGPHCTSHRGHPSNSHGIGCLRRAESFLYSSKLAGFGGKPSLQIKARTMLSEKCWVKDWSHHAHCLFGLFLRGWGGREEVKMWFLLIVFSHKQTMWQCESGLSGFALSWFSGK